VATIIGGCRYRCAKPRPVPRAPRGDGIHAAPYEQGEIGPDLFRHACLMKGWCRSTASEPMARAAAPTGSKLRTRSIQPIGGCRISPDQPGRANFFKPYDVTFRISGGQLHFLLRFHRLADDAPYFIGQAPAPSC